MGLPEKPQSAEELLGDDHEALNKLLKALVDALDKADVATVLVRLDLFWARLGMHIRAEHLHLFPALLNRREELPQSKHSPETAMTRETIARLRADHDFFMHELAGAIKTVRTLRDTGHSGAESQSMDEVCASIAAVSKRLGSHNEVEEKLVYSLPEKVLTPNELRTLAAGIRRELQNLPLRFSNGQARARADET